MLRNTIFAYGSGRSGTTLLAKLIDSSRTVLYRHEPDKTLPSDDIPFLPEPDDYARYREPSRLYLEQLVDERAAFVSGKRPVFEKTYRSAGGTRMFKVLLAVSGAAEKASIRLPVPDFTNGQPYRHLIKSVNSICRVPLFSQAAPDMKFVHILRHPGAVVASVLNGVKQGKMNREGFLDSVSKMSNARLLSVSAESLESASFAEQSAYTWMVQNDKSQREMQDSPNYMMVSYEDLCMNMPERMAEMCEFIGIEFDTQMQSFIAALNGAKSDTGYFSVMKNPLSGIDKWERELDDETKEKVAAIVANSDVGRFVLDRYAAVTRQLHEKDV